MNRIVPEPLAKLPWRDHPAGGRDRLFGQVVLYSAAGGSLRPWALSQGIRFFVFLLARRDRPVLRARGGRGRTALAAAYGGLIV